MNSHALYCVHRLGVPSGVTFGSIEGQEKSTLSEMDEEKGHHKQDELDQGRRFYLITYPRTASNLLLRILALDKQPNVLTGEEMGGYFFMSMFYFSNGLKVWYKNVEEWTQEEREQVMESYQKCYNKFEELLDPEKTKGKIVFIKEHSYFLTDPTARSRFLFGPDSVREPPWSVREPPWTLKVPTRYGLQATHSSVNETVLPDEFLQTWLPTFLIRHPALVFPSYYRAQKKVSVKAPEQWTLQEAELKLGMTFHWTRAMYDWYTQHLRNPESKAHDAWPLVLDADDIMTEPQVLVRFCKITGLDPTKLQFEWAPAADGDLSASNSVFLSTLSASAGIVSDKTSANLDMDVEAKKWREEFGEHMGDLVEKSIRAAMPDYEFLKARRLRRISS